jgi:hypothetical protein
LELEKQERTIVKNFQLHVEARRNNTAILSKNALNLLVLLNKVPAEKFQEHSLYPLTFQLGFIHSILEEEVNIASATITDVGFQGLFPKGLLQVLYKYAREIERMNQDKTEFIALIDELITAFILSTNYYTEKYSNYGCKNEKLTGFRRTNKQSFTF